MEQAHSEKQQNDRRDSAEAAGGAPKESRSLCFVGHGHRCGEDACRGAGQRGQPSAGQARKPARAGAGTSPLPQASGGLPRRRRLLRGGQIATPLLGQRQQLLLDVAETTICNSCCLALRRFLYRELQASGASPRAGKARSSLGGQQGGWSGGLPLGPPAELRPPPRRPAPPRPPRQGARALGWTRQQAQPRGRHRQQHVSAQQEGDLEVTPAPSWHAWCRGGRERRRAQSAPTCTSARSECTDVHGNPYTMRIMTVPGSLQGHLPDARARARCRRRPPWRAERSTHRALPARPLGGQSAAVGR